MGRSPESINTPRLILGQESQTSHEISGGATQPMLTLNLGMASSLNLAAASTMGLVASSLEGVLTPRFSSQGSGRDQEEDELEREIAEAANATEAAHTRLRDALAKLQV